MKVRTDPHQYSICPFIKTSIGLMVRTNCGMGKKVAVCDGCSLTEARISCTGY